MSCPNFSPRSKTKKRLLCCVNGCESRYEKDLNLRFHGFPSKSKYYVAKRNLSGNLEKVDVSIAWKEILNIQNPTPSMRVCSLHFRSEDYVLAAIPAKKRFLKTNAVPSCNLPSTKGVDPFEFIEDKKSHTMEDVKPQIDEENCYPETSHRDAKNLSRDTLENMEWLKTEANNEEAESLPPIKRELPSISGEIFSDMCKSPISQCDIGIQVASDFIIPRFNDFIKNDNDLRTLTGIESFQILRTIVEIVKNFCGEKLSRPNVKMNIHDRVVMTYIKLKQNISYKFLAILFQCYRERNCQRIFTEMIQVLSDCMKVVIEWPSRECISKNLPKCFQGFEDVRVVLDCTEICIKGPKNFSCQSMTHSSHKNVQTCKIMIGVTPAARISYLSKVYGGNASEKVIFKQSELMRLLEKGDAVMVKRGFTIDDVCLSNGWKCYRPPNLYKKKPFSKTEASCQIAKARVPIQRINQRIKVFKIIRDNIPKNLLPLVEDIFTVICGTLNLSSPILKKEEFM